MRSTRSVSITYRLFFKLSLRRARTKGIDLYGCGPERLSLVHEPLICVHQWRLLQNAKQYRLATPFLCATCVLHSNFYSEICRAMVGPVRRDSRPPWSPSLAHSLNTDRHATSRNSQSNAPGWLMPDQHTCEMRDLLRNWKNEKLAPSPFIDKNSRCGPEMMMILIVHRATVLAIPQAIPRMGQRLAPPAHFAVSRLRDRTNDL